MLIIRYINVFNIQWYIISRSNILLDPFSPELVLSPSYIVVFYLSEKKLVKTSSKPGGLEGNWKKWDFKSSSFKFTWIRNKTVYKGSKEFQMTNINNPKKKIKILSPLEERWRILTLEMNG